MADGSSRPIEHIKAGDVVLSADPATGAQIPESVLQTFVRQANELWTIATQDGQSIQATGDHPFWVEGKGFVEARYLTRGDRLRRVDGRGSEITALCSDAASVRVYNLKIDNTHTYYASGLLVHNADYVDPADLSPTHGQTMSNRQLFKLADNIRQNGMKDTIKYVVHQGQKYIVDGHHRRLAAFRLGLKKVPPEEVTLPYGGYTNIDDLSYW